MFLSNKSHLYYRNWLLLIAIFIITINFSCKHHPSYPQTPPKLVVGIVVDQMRADYINRFWNKFGNNGFKRMVKQGFLCENTNINYFQTETGPGHSAIYTGTTPSLNGIVANDWFSREIDKSMYCVSDSTVVSAGSTSKYGKMSPKNLISNTITDELHLASNFESKVIAISLKDRAAILPGGHTANAAYWFDPSNGYFISSSYYMHWLPKWVTTFNDRKLPSKYLDSSWTTSLPIDQYTESTADDNFYEGLLENGESKPVFPHNLKSVWNQNYQVLLKTPFGNSLLFEFAMETIKAEQLGKGNATDFLAVSFSSTDYVGHNYGINSIELEDTYIKLDKELGEFFDFVDSYLGKNNVLFFLTADHGATSNVQYALDHKMPAGLFDSKPVIDTLKSKLFKIYGDTNLVSAYINQNLYLNHKVIEEKKLSLQEVQNTAANILLKAKGVANTTATGNLIVSDNSLGLTKQIENGFNKSRSGDVIVTLLPGWMEWGKTTGTTHGSPYTYDTHIPLIFYGWKVKNGTYLPNVSITDIAPTIASLLNIQPPNSCTGKAIPVPLK
jgi:predicted AlkP superfamily pyrophosphatase or phosphodiesterase